MTKLLVNEVYWDMGKKYLIGKVTININQIKWVTHRSAYGESYYRVQFDTNLFVDVEDCEGSTQIRDWAESVR